MRLKDYAEPDTAAIVLLSAGILTALIGVWRVSSTWDPSVGASTAPMWQITAPMLIGMVLMLAGHYIEPSQTES